MTDVNWFDFDNRACVMSLDDASALVLSAKRGWVPVDPVEVRFTASPLSEDAAREAFSDNIRAWGEPPTMSRQSGVKAT